MSEEKEKTIFTDEFPLASNQDELNDILIKYDTYDSRYVTNGCIKERKKQYDELWTKYQEYADSTFLNEVKIGGKFYQRVWEMYIGSVFIKNDLNIQKEVGVPKNEGPDFIIDKNLYIECVAPTKGKSTKIDSVPEMLVAERLEDIQLQDVPIDQMIMRITQSIKYKGSEQYKKWRSKPWFDPSASFIIAISTEDLGHVDNPNMPNVLKAIFGFQFMQIGIKTGSVSYTYRNSLEKHNKEPVNVNFFTNADYNFVSGILFTDQMILGDFDIIGSDCILVNNPFAENPPDKSFAKIFRQWIATAEGDVGSLKKNY